MKSDKAVVLLPQYLAFIDITQITKCLPCADVNARAYSNGVALLEEKVMAVSSLSAGVVRV